MVLQAEVQYRLGLGPFRIWKTMKAWVLERPARKLCMQAGAQRATQSPGALRSGIWVLKREDGERLSVCGRIIRRDGWLVMSLRVRKGTQLVTPSKSLGQ